MGHIEATRELTASQEALSQRVSDLKNWDTWFSIHERWMEEPPATLSEGIKLTAKIVMLGMANKIDWTIESLQAPHTLVLSGTGMAGVKALFQFCIEPSGSGGSRFSVSGDFSGSLIKGALGKAVEKDGAKQLDKTLTQLDALASV